MGTISEQAAILRQQWETDRRWTGIERTYSAEDVIRLRGSVAEEHTLAWLGAVRLWDLLHGPDVTRAVRGSQAMRMAAAEPRAAYLSGGRVARDGNLAGQTCPPGNPMPAMVRQVNRAMLRADSVACWERGDDVPAPRWPVPVVADAEAGSSGVLNAFDLVTAMIEAGAAGIHFEDRVPMEKADGQSGGAVLIPTARHVQTLNAARLAADVLDVPAIVIARTAATAGTVLASDADERDDELLTGEQTAEGFYRVRPDLYGCVTRGLAFAPYADLLWLEVSAPDLAEARAFAQIIHSRYPGKMLAYSCPSRDGADTAQFQEELAAMGYRFQLIAPAGSRTPAARQLEADIRYFDRVTQAITPERDIAALAVALESAHFVGDDQIDHHGRLVPAD
ncbi:MAG: isocitrate lyase/phosphoenolpyruvate mutase family protein [Nocardiopsaceae bacterium]|nr:isocitrate lyase/phosphoenolpyruvate mutase family protein [Nocardiopsaceae bacterium]